MNTLTLINLENVSESEAQQYKRRDAARAVLFDTEGNVGLLHVTKHSYHKLPGGGVEEGETIEDALRRECLEEIGCAIEIGEPIGEIIEYRKEIATKQHSFCYLATVVGEKGEPNMDQGEIDLGFAIEWHPLDAAIELISNQHPMFWMGKFIVVRDAHFLSEARKLRK